MIYIFLHLLLCVVATADQGVNAKFETDLPYLIIDQIGKATIIPLIKPEIPTLFPSITPEHIINLDVTDVNGMSAFSIEIDPNTPNLDSILRDVKDGVDSKATVTVSTLTVTTTPGSFVVSNYEGYITVKFDCLLTWTAVGFVGEEEVIQGFKDYAPQYVDSLSSAFIKDVQLEERNRNIGVNMLLYHNIPNVYNVLFESKEFVECGTVIKSPGQPDIALDETSFGVVYPYGTDPILKGNESVSCPGQTTTTTAPALTPRITRRFITKKPATAGSARTVGQMLRIVVALALAVAIWIIY